MEIATCVRAFVGNPKGEILLVQHKADRPWTLPGGHVEVGEVFDIALARELREEFHIHIHFDCLSYEAKESFVCVQPLPLTMHTISYENSRGETVMKQELFYKVFTDEEIQYHQESEIFAWKWWNKEDILESAAGMIYPNIVEIIKQKF